MFMLGASSPPEQQASQGQAPEEGLSLEAQFTRAQARVSQRTSSLRYMSALRRVCHLICEHVQICPAHAQDTYQQVIPCMTRQQAVMCYISTP